MFSDREVELEDPVPQDHKSAQSAQSAIDALNPGDTILVAPVKYREGIRLTSGIFVRSGEVLKLVRQYRQYDVLIAIELKAEIVEREIVRLAQNRTILQRLLFMGKTISLRQAATDQGDNP